VRCQLPELSQVSSILTTRSMRAQLFACADTRLTCFAGLRLLRSRHVASRHGLSSAAERRCDMPEIAGSIPAVRTAKYVVFFQRQGTRFLTPGNTGSTPVHDP
jgi:hypothetical protein